MTTHQTHDTGRADDPAPRASLAGWAAVAVAALAVTGGTTLLLGRADRLPDRIITHWGSDGPDDWSSLNEVLVTAGAIIGVLTLGLVGLGFAMQRTERHLMSAVGAGTAVFVAVVAYGSAAAQADGGTVRIGVLIAAAGVAGVLIGVGLAWWARPRPPVLTAADRADVPDGVPRLDAPAGARVAWVGRSATNRAAILISLLLMVVVAPALGLLVDWALVPVAAVPLLIPLTLTSARVTIGPRGVTIRSLGLIRWTHVPLEHVASAAVGEVSPLREFGGWGYRVAFDGRRGFVTRAGEALVIRRIRQADVLVTIDDADQAAATLNTLVERAG